MKSCSAVLVSVILILILGNGRKEFSVLLSVAICSMVVLSAAAYLKPVISFVRQLERLGNLESSVVLILLKTVGIGILTEISVMICSDSGNGSMGKALQYLGTAVILWLSLPLFTMLTELLQRILDNL